MNPDILYRNDLDTRREVHALLEHLRPARRLSWLRWCCGQCVLPGSQRHPGIAPLHTGTAMEVFFDFWNLVNSYRLDSAAALTRLVEMAKGKTLE